MNLNQITVPVKDVAKSITFYVGFSYKNANTQIEHQNMRHCSLRSLVARGLFMDALYFLRHSAENEAHPRKSPQRRVSGANNVA